MRRIKYPLQISVAVVVLATTLVANVPKNGHADAANAPSLVISQLKITSSNGQFVTLYNPTDTELDMSHYQLEYFNNYDLGKATSSRLIALSGTVPPHGYFMVNDDALLLCYRLTVDSVSLGFSSTAGFVEVLSSEQSGPGRAITPVLQDYVGWSKTAASGAQTLPSNTNAFLQRQPVDAGNNPAITLPGAGNWQTVQPDSGNACNLITATTDPTSVPTGLDQLLPGSEAPATILAADSSSGQPAPASMPAADIGLMAPSVTELLPNPAGTGNDGTDEFIEVYNPNAKTFDLSGFGLQVGATTLHNYTLPTGTSLSAHGFAAFYSSSTKLSLSNTSGQAKLLDPFGNSISASGVYGTAKDGVAWALAKGKWYWTTEPTPGKANVIKQPLASKKSSSKKSTSKVKSASDIKRVKATSASSSSGGASDDAGFTPVHPWTLAIVAGLALLYGTYEYRADLANHIHQLRRHVAAGRRGRP